MILIVGVLGLVVNLLGLLLFAEHGHSHGGAGGHGHSHGASGIHEWGNLREHFRIMQKF